MLFAKHAFGREGNGTMDDARALMLLSKALLARGELSVDREVDAWRMVNGKADGFPWLTADFFKGAVLVEQHREDADPGPLISALPKIFDRDIPIFLKERWRRDPAERRGAQIRGASTNSDLVLVEDGIRFGVKLTGSHHVGIFIDSRQARRRVREIARGKRVLNLFSYTGGFGLAAAAGGARSATNVDNKRSALEAARRNFSLNGFTHDTRTFVRSDVEKYLKRRAATGGEFDLVVLDPPPRYRRPGRNDFVAARSYSGMLARCAGVLASGGKILAGLNSLGVDEERFDRILSQAAARIGGRFVVEELIGPGIDFPPCDERPVARFRLCTIGE